MAYNPYARPGQQQQFNPYGGNPLNQEAPAKTFSIPTWLAWLLGIGSIAFIGWLVWFMYFSS